MRSAPFSFSPAASDKQMRGKPPAGGFPHIWEKEAHIVYAPMRHVSPTVSGVMGRVSMPRTSPLTASA